MKHYCSERSSIDRVLMIKEANRKIKVLLLAPVSVSQGGIANWARLLLAHATGEKVCYKTLDTSVHYRVLGGSTGFGDRLWGLRDAFARGLKLIRDLLFYRPDIVYFTCAPSVGFAFRDAPQILLCKLLGLKVIIHLRGGNLTGFWGGGWVRRFLANAGSRLADYIFVITRDCETAARKQFGNSKVIYVPNYIDTNSRNEADDSVPPEIRKDKFNIVHIAFQHREKGTFEIIECAKDLPDSVNILLIGSVSEDNRARIEEAIHKNGAAAAVTLLGPREKPQLWDYYSNADLLLFPTYSEGFPNVILEAMLFGVPILATNVGNIAEMVDATGEKPAAVLLDKADPPSASEIGSKIKLFIESPELRQTLSSNGLGRVKSVYSVDTVLNKLESILSAIVLDQDVLSQAKEYFPQNEILP
ncbi:MAG: glycosyltransferase family 4 protein [Planctomycetaceae bacterium]|nr:glycosyltransferase family 4 protein [Planctomycetaceae bacterium]